MSDIDSPSTSRTLLAFLGDNPHVDVSLRQLARVTPVSERATHEAVEVLEANELPKTFHQGNARRVHVNRDRLERPDDPILSIPQTHLQTLVRVACRDVETTLDKDKGIGLPGSVARGDADRRSEIDLWILVGEDPLQQRHVANELAGHLKTLSLPSSIAIDDAESADLEQNREAIRETLDGDESGRESAQRYSFELVVESPQSILGLRVDASWADLADSRLGATLRAVFEPPEVEERDDGPR